MVFQDPFASLNPRFTVRRTVEEPLVIHGLGDREARTARANTTCGKLLLAAALAQDMGQEVRR